MRYEIQEDPAKQRIWVHASDGSTVARFDTRFGMDIHNSVTDQLAGASECLYCTHEKPTQSDWTLFREYAQKLWGVQIHENSIEI